MALTQRQPPNIVDRAVISVIELNGMHQRIEEQQKKIDNSEMLGTAGARLEEELRQLKLESQMLSNCLRPNECLNTLGISRSPSGTGGNIEERVGGGYKDKRMYCSGG